MEQKERVAIYIDGGNFHHLVLKRLAIKELDFAFEDFVHFLSNGRTITEKGKRFYVGTVRERAGDARSKKAMSQQTSFFSVLWSYHWETKTSKLRTRMERVVIDDRVAGYQELLAKGVRKIEFQRMREKGIDVKLATDLIVGAVDDQYDTAIVVSSDADLVPAIDWIRYRFKKKVEYIGFSIMDTSLEQNHTKPSQTLIGHSDIQRIFGESDLKRFVKPFTQQKS